MNLKKILQRIFKKIFQKIFIIFHGKIKKFTNFNLVDIKKTKLNKIKSDTFPEKEIFLYELNNGRIYTDTIENVAIIKDNVIIDNISFQQVHGNLKSSDFNIVLKTGTPRLKKKVNGTVFSMVQGASGNNYFHFLFDIITRLKLCEEKYPLSEIDYF